MDRERESLRQTQRPMQIKQVKIIKRSLPILRLLKERQKEGGTLFCDNLM